MSSIFIAGSRRLKIGELDSVRRSIVIAEIGNNHGGDFTAALELIEAAAESGADLVKFQTYVPEHLAGGDTRRLGFLRQCQLSFSDLERLAAHANDVGVEWFSTAFDIDSLKRLSQFQKIFKIASCDNNFFPLMDCIAGLGRPVILSTGLSDLQATAEAVNRITVGCEEDKSPSPVALLHCVSSYPTPLEEAGLSSIAILREKFPECEVGYSDHTLGIEAAIYAVAAGARIVEKHFTLDKSQPWSRDHQISADPEDMRQMVSEIRKVETALGQKNIEVQECELSNLSAARRSIAAGQSLDEGTILTMDNLVCVRPGDGIAANQFDQVIGKQLITPVGAFQAISFDDLK